MLLFLLSWAGFHVRVITVVPLIVVAALLLFAARRLSLRKFLMQPAENFSRRPLDEFEVFLILVIIACLGARIVASLLAPLNDNDGIAEWGLKAKIFYHNTIKTTDYFQRREFSFSNHSYPLLLPLMYAWMCAAIGQWDDLGMLILNPLNLVAFAPLLYFQARRLASRKVALAVTAIASSVPALLHYTECGQADVPLMLISGASVFCLCQWMMSRRFDSLMLAAVLAGGAMFTKNEGVILLALYLGTASLSVLTQSPRTEWKRLFGHILMYALVASFLALPWFLFSHWHVTNWNAFSQHMSLSTVRWHEIPAMMSLHWANWIHFHNSVQLPKWNILWPLLLITMLLSKSPCRHPGYCLLLISLGQFVAFSLLYLAAPDALVLGSGMEFGTERETLVLLPPLWLLLAQCAEEHWTIWRQMRSNGSSSASA
jgi:4-amino-4-deoxy-L-arabinose transferase-like glycosyltransferase